MRVFLIVSLICLACPARPARGHFEHPCLVIKQADLERARENQKRHAWARAYVDSLRKRADQHITRFTPAVVERMLEATTPISTIFTPCPACREQKKAWLPHGQWDWRASDPDRLTCALCGTVFPSEKYPESIVVQTAWGTPQTFTFIGGEPFVVFGFREGHPSISGCIRAHKVVNVVQALQELTNAYFLTSDTKYAATIRVILLRLAEVYPHWLVHSGYGQIADSDPRIAAATIEKLHTGFWSAGRATGHGQEGWFVKAVATAYDATFALYSPAERTKIEANVLIESTILLVADAKINNKSVGNRAAVAMVGLVCDRKELVDFGVEGFHKTIDEWFLPDGGTPESPAYALMTFSNTLDLPLAIRELYQAPRYRLAWERIVDGLQGDCTLAPYADTRAKSRFPGKFAEVLASQYPDRAQYRALLKELPLSEEYAIYYREADFETKPAPALVFPDFCPPELRIGHMRTGADGRESLALLSASHWGGHHHFDSLNLYYWKDGQELLSDLGYLWDNPQKRMTARVLAHNTVILDEQEQRNKERGGEVHFFETSPHVKMMRASSSAYAQAKRYERTVALIDHGDGRSYLADFFIVEGGKTQDYVFHGPNQSFSAKSESADITLYDLSAARRLQSVRIEWTLADEQRFTAFLPRQHGEEQFIADGWGQRDSYNKDRGATLPYVIRRTSGDSVKFFAGVFAAHPADAPFVQRVQRIHRGSMLALKVETLLGIDYIESHPKGLNVTSKTNGKTNWTFIHED